MDTEQREGEAEGVERFLFLCLMRFTQQMNAIVRTSNMAFRSP